MNLFMAQAAEAGRRDIERPAGESGDEQVLPRRAEPVLDGYSSSCSHITVRKASFHAVVLAHAARRSEALQDLTWHAARLPAAGAFLGEWAKIELIVGAAQVGCVLQLDRAVSFSCAVLRRCRPCRRVGRGSATEAIENLKAARMHEYFAIEYRKPHTEEWLRGILQRVEVPACWTLGGTNWQLLNETGDKQLEEELAGERSDGVYEQFLDRNLRDRTAFIPIV